MAIDTSSPLWCAQLKFESFVAVKEDLSVVGDLLDVRSVVIETHVANQENLAMVEISRERTVRLLTTGGSSGPITIHACCGVVSFQFVTILK